jgi:vitamin B12 transporter
MRKPLSAVLAASLVATAVPATAQQAFRLDEIVFAGGLSPVPQAALGRSVTVITADEIRDRQIDQLPDLLRSLPGIAVNRTGGPGGLVDLRLRGTKARHVLVIMDGVRLDLPRFGGTNITGLQTADIERIEILRGPQSVFFGSDTIGGVISITTTRARDPGFAGRAGVEAGSDRTIGLDFGLTQRGARGGIALSGVLRNEGGFDVSATPGGARDGMRIRTLNLSGDFALTETWRIGAQLRLRNQRNEFDGFDFGAPAANVVFDQDNFDVIRERIASVFAEGELLDGRMELTLRPSRFRDTPTGFADAVFSSRQRHTRTEQAARGTIALDAPTLGAARHTLACGMNSQSGSTGPRRTAPSSLSMPAGW